MNKKSSGRKILLSNKNARRLFNITETMEAGIVLVGCEVKSLRDAKANFNDAFVYFKGGEAFLKNLHISPYKHGGYMNPDPLRARKLLMNKREIEKWSAAVQQKGQSVIPISIYLCKGLIKVELGLGKGKKLHDKREDLKKKEAKKEIARAFKR